MIGKALTLAGGMAGAAALSQYPEFSQQYIQRLGGQVDALSAIVTDFDRSATQNGLSRAAALDELQGTPFLAARKSDMQTAFARYDRLSGDLTFLRLATPIERITMPHRLADPDTFTATWADFRPALPLSLAGVVAAAMGFVVAWGVVRIFLSLLLWPFRRRSASRKPADNPRQDPLMRPQRAAQVAAAAPEPAAVQKAPSMQKPLIALRPKAAPKPTSPRASNAPRKQPILRRPAQ